MPHRAALLLARALVERGEVAAGGDYGVNGATVQALYGNW